MRIVIGKTPDAPITKAAMFALVARIYDRAHAAGFTQLEIDHSRVARSSSRYISMTGPDGNIWIVRVADHRRPGKSPHARPHFDLTSLDGVSGVPETVDWLTRAFAGEIMWEDTSGAACHRRKPKKIKKPRR